MLQDVKLRSPRRYSPTFSGSQLTLKPLGSDACAGPKSPKGFYPKFLFA
jgi:hypothetical protein